MKKFMILFATLTLLLCCSLSIVTNVSASSEPKEKLLFTADFSTIPVGYTTNNGWGISGSSVSDQTGSGLDDYCFVYESFLNVNNFFVEDYSGDSMDLRFGSYSSKYFYQTQPGTYMTEATAEQPRFFLSLDGSTRYHKKVSSNETRVKIYIDPVEYYYHGKLYQPQVWTEDITDGVCIQEFVTKQTRTTPKGLSINGEIVYDNVTGVISVDLTDMTDLYISRFNGVNDSERALLIYKIEFYGIEEAEETGAPGAEEGEPTVLDKLFESIGLTGLTIGVQIVIIVAAIIVLKKVIK